MNPWACPSRRERGFLATPGKRSTTSSTTNRGSVPRWRSGSRRSLAARRKPGYGCILPTISHRPEKTRTGSRSAVSMCSKECTRSDETLDRRFGVMKRDQRPRPSGAWTGQPTDGGFVKVRKAHPILPESPMYVAENELRLTLQQSIGRPLRTPNVLRLKTIVLSTTNRNWFPRRP